MNNKKYRNTFFIIVSIIGGIFIVSPIILRIPIIRDFFSWFLKSLGNSDYKSSYIETFGAILGTFLAVAGTLWTQRKLDEVTLKKELKESALIVYYDFYFALNDIITFVHSYMLTKQPITNTIDDIEIYQKYRKKYRIYIDDNWIHNVAKLSSVMLTDEIKLIYKLYGDLCTIRNVFNSPTSDVNIEEEKLAYSIMLHEICNLEFALKYPIVPEISLKTEIENLMTKLKEISENSNIKRLSL